MAYMIFLTIFTLLVLPLIIPYFLLRRRYIRRRDVLIRALVEDGYPEDCAVAELNRRLRRTAGRTRLLGLVMIVVGIGGMVLLLIVGDHVVGAGYTIRGGGLAPVILGILGTIAYGLFQLITGADASFATLNGRPEVPSSGYSSPLPKKLHDICSICGSRLGRGRRVIGLCADCERRAG